METGNEQTRIPEDQMKAEFFRILLRLGFSTDRAYKCAEIFTRNSLEGVYSHGVYRFLRFVRDIKEGHIIPDSIPTLVAQSGALEQWNGNLGRYIWMAGCNKGLCYDMLDEHLPQYAGLGSQGLPAGKQPFYNWRSLWQ